MAINDERLREWIRIVSAVPGVEMDGDALVDDIVLIAHVFDDPQRFETAMSQIVNSLNLIVKKRDMGAELKSNLSAWRCFHFQSRRTAKHPADLRIVYQDTGAAIRVRGFGHRWLPDDIYRRLYLHERQ